jgi:hypothetical protein
MNIEEATQLLRADLMVKEHFESCKITEEVE